LFSIHGPKGFGGLKGLLQPDEEEDEDDRKQEDDEDDDETDDGYSE